MSAFLKVNRAKNWREFVAAFDTYAVSAQNIMYADQDGNIGMVFAYRKPVVEPKPQKFSFILSKDQKIARSISPTELEPRFNPTEGFIASANNRPKEHEVGLFFAPDDRVNRIREIAQSKEKIGVSDLIDMQSDRFSPISKNFFERVREDILPIVSLSRVEKEFFEQFIEWNFVFESASKKALYFEFWSISLAKLVFKERYKTRKLIQKALKNSEWKKLLWFSLEEIKEPRKLSKFFSKSIRNAKKKYKKYQNWGEVRKKPARHLLAFLPVIGSKYVFEELPAEGDFHSLQKNAANPELGVSEVFYGQNSRHISDLSDVNENYFVQFGGNDGWIGSGSMTDQIPLWKKYEYIQMPLEPEKIREQFSYRVDQIQPK